MRLMWYGLLICLLFVCLNALVVVFFFFFNDTATTEIYTLSLHDALPICGDDGHLVVEAQWPEAVHHAEGGGVARLRVESPRDRKSTRLNSSHLVISYAVFCLKKKKNTTETLTMYTATNTMIHS